MQVYCHIHQIVKIFNNWHTFHAFQKVFNRAFSSLLEGGIYQKIEKDIKTSKVHRGYFDVFWAHEKLRPNKPFTIDHATPAFLVLGCGLTPASLIFVLELVQHFCRKKITNMASEFSLLIISKVDKGDHRYGKGHIEDTESGPYLK